MRMIFADRNRQLSVISTTEPFAIIHCRLPHD
jgi:hypothetical protein